MTALAWPAGLNFRSVAPELAGMTIGGGRALSGTEQRTLRHPGFWQVRVAGIAVNTAARAKAYRVLIARLRAGDTVDVPVPDPYRPVGGGLAGAAVTASAASAGATTLAVTVSGPDVDPGHYVSIAGRLHLVTEVTSGTGIGTFNQLVTGSPWDDAVPWVDAPTVAAATTLRLLPPLRAAVSSGAALTFDRPVITCRLASPDTGALTLDVLRFGSADLDLVEAF